MMELMFEVLLFFLICLAVMMLGLIIRKIGMGAINIVFISFVSGIFLLAESRLFLDLSSNGIYALTETTTHLWWHLIFYFSMLSFVWGGKRIKDIAGSTDPKGFGKLDVIVLGGLQTLGLGVFGLAPILELNIWEISKITSIDSLGIHHFVAMVLGMVAAYYMYHIKKMWGKVLGVGVVPWILFIIMMGLQHLWELLTESWKVLVVGHEVIEQVELVMLMVGLSALNLAVWRILKVVNKS